MSSHSEETWESFDALWRRMQQLARRVRELEARLEAIEHGEAHSVEAGFKSDADACEIHSGAILFEGEIHR